MLRLAASATGGARLRIPNRRDPFYTEFHLTCRHTQRLPCVRGAGSRKADRGVDGANYGDSLISPSGVALILHGAKPVRLSGGALLFYEEK